MGLLQERLKKKDHGLTRTLCTRRKNKTRHRGTQEEKKTGPIDKLALLLHWGGEGRSYAK